MDEEKKNLSKEPLPLHHGWKLAVILEKDDAVFCHPLLFLPSSTPFIYLSSYSNWLSEIN
jgi:hypothetical protein